MITIPIEEQRLCGLLSQVIVVGLNNILAPVKSDVVHVQPVNVNDNHDVVHVQIVQPGHQRHNDEDSVQG